MGVALGWQRMCNYSPFVKGHPWVDSVVRNGNTVSYSINFSMALEKQGYWDYVWYVDMQIGNNTSTGRQVKGRTGTAYIGGKEYYQSSFNSNFTGSTAVSGKATSVQLRARFTDSHGNIGPDCYWNVPIPAATSMDDIKATVSDIGTDTATISGAITKAGDYSTITSWKIEYGIDDYSENTNTKTTSDLSASWDLASLTPGVNYRYRITVASSSGYSKEYTGVFSTLEEDIGYKVTTGENLRLNGWIIFPDGTRKKLKEIRRVNPA